MKRAWVLLVVLSVSPACRMREAAPLKPPLIPSRDLDAKGGADLVLGRGDHQRSPYYAHPDVYNMKNSRSLTVLEKYRPSIQTAEWSCGPAVALAVLAHFGKTDMDEADIAAAMGSHADHASGGGPGTANRFGDYGTKCEEIVSFFQRLEGFQVVEASCAPPPRPLTSGPGWADVDQGQSQPRFPPPALYDGTFTSWLKGHLERGRPVMVEWADWDGHWQAVIGYDDMGTPGLVNDDALVMADPYDTTDHWQDGYFIVPLERFFYMWSDRKIAPAPHKLQQFVVVDRRR